MEENNTVELKEKVYEMTKSLFGVEITYTNELEVAKINAKNLESKACFIENDFLSNIFKKYDIPKGAIEIELTESLFYKFYLIEPFPVFAGKVNLPVAGVVGDTVKDIRPAVTQLSGKKTGAVHRSLDLSGRRVDYEDDVRSVDV